MSSTPPQIALGLGAVETGQRERKKEEKEEQEKEKEKKARRKQGETRRWLTFALQSGDDEVLHPPHNHQDHLDLTSDTGSAKKDKAATSRNIPASAFSPTASK